LSSEKKPSTYWISKNKYGIIKIMKNHQIRTEMSLLDIVSKYKKKLFKNL